MFFVILCNETYGVKIVINEDSEKWVFIII